MRKTIEHSISQISQGIGLFLQLFVFVEGVSRKFVETKINVIKSLQTLGGASS